MTRTRSQASKYAIAKGKNYERRIARVLSGWWGSTLHRTPTSGMNIYSGDIVDDKGQFPFIVECKKDEEWSLENLFSQTGRLWKFWNQAENNFIREDPHHQSNDPVLLIFSRRSGQDFFATDFRTFRLLESYCGGFSMPYITVRRVGEAPEDQMVIGTLEYFVCQFSGDMIKTIPEWRRE